MNSFMIKPLYIRRSVFCISRRHARRESVFYRDNREKRFKLGWSHLQERRPRNLQEKWHRALSIPSRVFNHDAIANLQVVDKGEKETFEWRMFFETTKLGDEDSDLKNVSPWHDIPLCFHSAAGERVFNFVNEIPKGDRAKIECNTKEDWNPMCQDIKKGKLRFFTYGDLPFNYGFLPQTWECPDTINLMTGLGGDSDPIDVVELSQEPLSCGEVVPLKLLGLAGLIDEGETDWKVIGINKNNPLASKINSIEDIDTVLGVGTTANIFNWFKMYKTTDGKPENSFFKDGEVMDIPTTLEVIKECHFQWMNLLLGREGETTKFSLNSVMYKMLLAQKVISSSPPPFMGCFKILNEEEKYPTKQDIEKIHDPKFAASDNK